MAMIRPKSCLTFQCTIPNYPASLLRECLRSEKPTEVAAKCVPHLSALMTLHIRVSQHHLTWQTGECPPLTVGKNTALLVTWTFTTWSQANMQTFRAQQKTTMPSTCTIHANTHASMKESPFQANIHETSIMRHQIIFIYYEFNYMVINVQLMQMTERIKPGAWGHMSQKGCNSCTLHPVVRPLPGEAVSGNLLLNKTHCILHQCYFIPSSTIQHEYFTST